MARKTVYIFAGTNGAGKTTFAQGFLPFVGCRHFLNADIIARQIAPFDVESAAVPAARKVIKRRFFKGLRNFFEVYAPLADECILLDNTYHHTLLVAELKRGRWNVELPDLFESAKNLGGTAP